MGGPARGGHVSAEAACEDLHKTSAERPRRYPCGQAADVPFVFDRFYRSAAARGLPGFGLGLAIVLQAAELHGGRAEVSSTGHGAVLRLVLPLEGGSGQRADRPGRSHKSAGRGRLTWPAARSSPPGAR